jgi:hypothetical protein
VDENVRDVPSEYNEGKKNCLCRIGEELLKLSVLLGGLKADGADQCQLEE